MMSGMLERVETSESVYEDSIDPDNIGYTPNRPLEANMSESRPSEMIPDTSGLYAMPGGHPDILTLVSSPMPFTAQEGAIPKDSSHAFTANASRLCLEAIHSMYEQIVSAWYAPPGIILFAVLSTHAILSFTHSFIYTVIVLIICGSHYSLSQNRLRRRIADDARRDSSRRGEDGLGIESAEWLNGFWERYWLMYEPILSQSILDSVNSILPSYTPAFLDSLSITSLTLGNKAPRLDNIRIYPNTPPDTVMLDCDISFIPNDLMDLTPRQAQRRTNPKIVLAARLGKAGLGPSLPILLEDIELTGKMRIKLKLMPSYPHIKSLSLSFLEEPFIDHSLKPLGNNFGFDVNIIPGLSSFIQGQIHTGLGGLIYHPNSYTMDFSGVSEDQAIGVLNVTIKDAQGLRAVKFGGGDPDPYVSIGTRSDPRTAKTRAIHSTTSPAWHETHYVLVSTLEDTLDMSVWDYNTHRADNQLGTVKQDLSVLAENAELVGLTGRVIGAGKDRGKLRYDLSFYPAVQSIIDEEALSHTATTDIRSGIVRLKIHGALGLGGVRGRGLLSTYAQVLLEDSHDPIYRTTTLKRCNEPAWDGHCEFFVLDKQESDVTVQIINSKDPTGSPLVGKITMKLSDLLHPHGDADGWFPLQDPAPGKIRLTATFRPVPMDHRSGSTAYIPPIGIIRIHIKSARDVKNVEIAHGGKSDPYVRTLGKNGTIVARTEVRHSTLDPDWDEIVYVPVHGLKDVMLLDLMDHQSLGKDRPLGSVEVEVTDLAKAVEGSETREYPYEGSGRQERRDPIRLNEGETLKGVLNYTAEFLPSMALRGGMSFSSEGEGPDRNKATNIMPPVSADYSMTTLRSLSETPIPLTESTLPSPITTVEEISGEYKELLPALQDRGLSLTRQELLSKLSGLLIIHLISGTLPRRGRVEILIDDGSWPSITFSRARSNHQKWDEVGEGFIRELDYSRIWLRVNASEEAGKEEIIADLRCDTRDFLEACLDGPAEFNLLSADGLRRCVLRLSGRYIPVDIKLELRESINNMGVLRCEVLRAKHLLAVHRGGKSDPNITFSLNGNKVYKTETKKKTLSPDWDEAFEVMIPSRVNARFEFEINDWDLVGPANYLGSGIIDVTRLEPFKEVEMACTVVHDKRGHHGSLIVRLMFQPEIIARTRNRSSTFAVAGRAMTQVGGLPLAAGKGVLVGGGAVAMGVGRGVGTVGGIAGRKIGLIKKRSKSGRQVLVETDRSDLMICPSGITIRDDTDQYDSASSSDLYDR